MQAYSLLSEPPGKPNYKRPQQERQATTDASPKSTQEVSKKSCLKGSKRQWARGCEPTFGGVPGHPSSLLEAAKRQGNRNVCRRPVVSGVRGQSSQVAGTPELSLLWLLTRNHGLQDDGPSGQTPWESCLIPLTFVINPLGKPQRAESSILPGTSGRVPPTPQFLNCPSLSGIVVV